MIGPYPVGGLRSDLKRSTLDVRTARLREIDAVRRGLDDARAHYQSPIQMLVARRLTAICDICFSAEIDVPPEVMTRLLVTYARAIATVAAAAGAPGKVEYWKSAPFLLNFLRGYKLSEAIKSRSDAPDRPLRDTLRAATRFQLDRDRIEGYEPLAVPSGRIRKLMEMARESDLDRQLWMPPALPYFGLQEAASKILVFSEWSMVPDELDDPALLTAAARIGMGFRTLFNQPEAQALLRAESEDHYWRAVLHHAATHDLQSVLDEYAHVLLESEGLTGHPPGTILPRLAERIVEALTLRPAPRLNHDGASGRGLGTAVLPGGRGRVRKAQRRRMVSRLPADRERSPSTETHRL